VAVSARPDSRFGSRALTAIAALAASAGIVVTGVALAGGGASDQVVLDVEPAMGQSVLTVAPLATDPDDTTVDQLDEVRRPAPGVERSPAGQPRELLGPRGSAIPEPVAPRAQPVNLAVEGLDVGRFRIRPIGLEDDGQLEIPDETEIGWYRYGAAPGRPGATVLAAHVSWNRTVGPFARLGSVEPGDDITVTLDGGVVRRYLVTERAVYGKLDLPRERIWSNSGPETLVLITCGGAYNPNVRRYADNIVVYAAPVG
jgi:hypothetical protein